MGNKFPVLNLCSVSPIETSVYHDKESTNAEEANESRGDETILNTHVCDKCRDTIVHGKVHCVSDNDQNSNGRHSHFRIAI